MKREKTRPPTPRCEAALEQPGPRCGPVLGGGGGSRGGAGTRARPGGAGPPEAAGAPGRGRAWLRKRTRSGGTMSRLREEDDPYVVEEPSDEERALSRCLELLAGGGPGLAAAGPGPRPACAGPGAQRCRALSAGALAWRWVSAPAARGAQEDRPNISRDDLLETGVFLFLISQLPAPRAAGALWQAARSRLKLLCV